MDIKSVAKRFANAQIQIVGNGRRVLYTINGGSSDGGLVYELNLSSRSLSFIGTLRPDLFIINSNLIDFYHQHSRNLGTYFNTHKKIDPIFRFLTFADSFEYEELSIEGSPHLYAFTFFETLLIKILSFHEHFQSEGELEGESEYRRFLREVKFISKTSGGVNLKKDGGKYRGLAQEFINSFGPKLREMNTVADVGGGNAGFLLALKELYPKLRMVIYESPEQVEILENMRYIDKSGMELPVKKSVEIKQDTSENLEGNVAFYSRLVFHHLPEELQNMYLRLFERCGKSFRIIEHNHPTKLHAWLENILDAFWNNNVYNAHKTTSDWGELFRGMGAHIRTVIPNKKRFVMFIGTFER